MHATAFRPFLSLGEVADLLSVQSWRIARLFELQVLPEPERIAGRRLIPKEMIPEVIDALRARGWLPESSPMSESGAKTDDRAAAWGQERLPIPPAGFDSPAVH